MSWLDIAGAVWEALSPVFALLLTWAGIKLTALIKARVQNELYQGMTMRLKDSVLTLVREAEQTAVSGIRAARSPSSPGGKMLTEKEAAEIRDRVLDKFKRLWGPDGIKELLRILGLTDGVLDAYLIAEIEAAVAAEKRK
jgi:hypothetical protein